MLLVICAILESAFNQKCHISFSAQRATISDHIRKQSFGDYFRRNYALCINRLTLFTQI